MKLDFDINKKNNLSVIALYGSSGISFVASEVEDVDIDENLLKQMDQRIKIDAKTYVLGTTHTIDFTPKTKLTTLLSFVRSDTHMPVDTMSLIQPNAEWKLVWDEQALEDKYSLYSKIEHRFSYTSLIEAGVKYDFYDVDYLEKSRCLMKWRSLLMLTKKELSVFGVLMRNTGKCNIEVAAHRWFTWDVF